MGEAQDPGLETDPNAAEPPPAQAMAPKVPGPFSDVPAPSTSDAPFENLAEPAGHQPERDSILTWKLLAVVIAVLGLVGLGASLALSRLDSEKSATTTPKVTTTVYDDFARDTTSGLGTAPSGQEWTTPLGTWAAAGGKASVAIPNDQGGGRNIALIDLGSPNGSVSAKADRMTSGWGLIFRYQGQYNYWMISATPKFGAFTVMEVEDGKVRRVGTASGSVVDGVIVKVVFQGPKLTVFIDGKETAAVIDSTYRAEGPNGQKVGMVGDRAAVGAEWSTFAANKLGPGANAPSTSLTTVPPTPDEDDPFIPESDTVPGRN